MNPKPGDKFVNAKANSAPARERVWRLTRATKAAVWLIPAYYGFNPPRGSSRRVLAEDFAQNWVKAPHSNPAPVL